VIGDMKKATSQFMVNAATDALSLAVWLMVAVWFMAVPDGRAQSNALQHASSFVSTEYYGATNQHKVKSILSGVEAVPQPGGLLLIKQLKLEIYDPAGGLQWVVNAPECVYDTFNGVANSPGPLQVQSGDGKFHIQGEGFLWRQSDSFLTISNNVRTVVEPGAKMMFGS
jgi:hypothetical protein